MGLLRKVGRKVLNTVLERAPHVPAGPPTTRPAPPPSTDSGAEMANIECGAQELKERLDAGESVTVVDVREPHETQNGVIAGAILIPLGQIEVEWERVKDANEVVTYCALGARSLQAASFLRSKGVFNATSMDGGIVAWTDAGGVIVPPEQ